MEPRAPSEAHRLMEEFKAANKAKEHNTAQHSTTQQKRNTTSSIACKQIPFLNSQLQGRKFMGDIVLNDFPFFSLPKYYM